MITDDEVYPIFAKRFGEILEILDKAKGLIENHLDGHPVDVFYIGRVTKPEHLI